MNVEVAKRTIYESEAVIKSNENLVGMGLWNIGNELKVIRFMPENLKGGKVTCCAK